jgi:hypothetical protein
VQNGSILWTGNLTESRPSTDPGSIGAPLLMSATWLAESFPNKAPKVEPKPVQISPDAIKKLALITANPAAKTQTFRPKLGEAQQSDRDRQVEDIFVQVLLDKGYKLVSRTDLQAVLKEQAFQQSGLTEDNAVAAGKLLNVPAVLILGVTDANAAHSVGSPRSKAGIMTRAGVGARLLDVGTGEVQWAHAQYKSKPVADATESKEVLNEVSKSVAQFFPPLTDSASRILERGTALEAMGQLTAARRQYKRLVEEFPKSTENKMATARLKIIGN